MVLFALGLVLVQALTIQANLFSQTHPGDDIDALCARKSVNLTTFTQLKRLGQGAESSVSCTSSLKQAITDLVKLIESAKDDLCSVESIYALRAYYFHYLDSSNDELEDPLPKSLRRFVLAYGMQMSNLCKKNMIKVLTEEGHNLDNASEFEKLGAIIKDNGPVAQVLDAISNPGEVFLPGDLIPFLKKHGVKSDELGGGDKLVMQTATSDYIKNMQSVCQRQFKPVYEPLIMPLVRLVNLGFDYKDEPLKADLASPQIVHDVARWSRIVFLCEALANVRIVHDEDDGKLVRILTKEEADAIEGPQLPYDVSGTNNYTPHNVKVMLGDEIYNKTDKQLDKSIKSFKTNHGEEYILRRRVTKKGLELVKKQLKSGHFGFIFSAAWKSMMRKGEAVNSPTKQFVETLNDMVDQQQQAAMSSSSDAPVSFSYSDYNVEINIAGLVAFFIIFFILAGIGFGCIPLGR